MQERTGALTAYAQSRICDRDVPTPDEIDAQLPRTPPLHCAPLSFHFRRGKVNAASKLAGGNKR